MKPALRIFAAVVAAGAMNAHADINIGVSVSATGPAAVLGGPEKNTTALFPSSFGGEKINWIVLDDATDPTNAAKNTLKLLGENKVDLLIGSSTTATTGAMLDAVVESKTPLLALAPIDLSGDNDKWTFRMPQHNALMAKALFEHMKANNVKSLGFIGFADPYGESWLKVMEPMAATKAASADYAKKYEDMYGAGTLSAFGGHMWDAWSIASRAIPVALKKAKPGTPEFRAALRDAIENEREVVGVHAVFNMSPTDHFGHDERARVLMRIDNGAFKIIATR